MSTNPIRVKNVMRKEVPSIDGMASAKEAAAMMRDSKVSELLVAKRNENDAWGILTSTDLVKKVMEAGRDAEHVFVYEIMTKPVVAVSAEMDIRYAIRLVGRIGVHRAPVEHHGNVVGMFSLTNLILENDLL